MTSATLHWREQTKISAIARGDDAQQVISISFIFDARLSRRSAHDASYGVTV
jgi:hypothetical protein